jgi:hypothetical protein
MPPGFHGHAGTSRSAGAPWPADADVMPMDAGEPPHEFTTTETEAVAALTAAKTTSGPRLKVELDGEDKVRLRVDHPDQAVGILTLMRAIGTTDPDFYDGLIGHLANASWGRDALSQSGTNFMLSVVRGIERRDQIEAMLGAQMAAVTRPR